MSTAATAERPQPAGPQVGPQFAVILSLGFCHMLNDMMQSLVPAIYPVLKDSHGLDFGQIGCNNRLPALVSGWTLVCF